MPKDILVVDDEKGVLAAIGVLISHKFGVEPFLCSNSADALEIIRTNKIKALILDYQLGKGEPSGVELLKIVRNRLRLNVPCILVTGLPEQASAAIFRADIANLGRVAFFNKPFDFGEFLPALREALQEYQCTVDATPALRIDKVLGKKRSILKSNVESKLSLASAVT